MWHYAGQEEPLEDMAIHPVFLLGEYHGQRSLAGDSTYGRTEWDTNKVTLSSHTLICEETAGATGCFHLGGQNEAEHRLTNCAK